jgi:DNA-binding CsgD family transcriptional regulator
VNRSGSGSAIVGRQSELGAFPPFLDAVADGPAVLVLEGDAGIGKTALWTEGVRQGRKRGYEVLTARPGEAETQLPFAVLGDLFESVSGEVLASLPHPQRLALDVAMLRAAPTADPIEGRAVSLAVLSVLRGLAVEVPVLLALDDLQWIDRASAAALQFALRRLESERIGCLGARRGRGGEVPSGLPEAQPGGQVRRLEIGPLDRDALAQLLLRQLRAPLPPPAIVQLHRVSAGNPFLALEIARALERRGVRLVPGEPFPVPQTLRELVRDRLEHLPPSARGTALLIAALPQPTVRRIEEAARGTGAESDGLDHALTAGIIEVEGERVRFTHPLLGSIIYSEAPRARRRELHAHLATLADDVEEQARHLALATQGPDARVAAALDEAASRALVRGASEAAAELYEHAGLLTPQDERESRWRRGFEAADCHLKAGDTGAAESLLSSLAAEAPSRDLRAQALCRLSSAKSWRADWQAAVHLLDEAVHETTDPGVRGQRETLLAWVEWFGGNLLAAIPHIRAAVSLVEKSGDRNALAEVLGARAFLEGMLGEESSEPILRRALVVADSSAPIRRLRQPDRWLPTLAIWADELEQAAVHSYTEYRKALEAGDEHALANVLQALTDVERLRGNWEAGARFADEMHRASVLTGQEFMRAIALGKLGLVHALMGRAEEARREAREGMALAERVGTIAPTLDCLHVLGFLELSVGNAAKAHDHLGSAVAAAANAGMGEPGVLRFVPDDVEALVELGRLDEAASILEPFEERATALGRAWAIGASLRCRALLLDARRDTTARETIEDAVRCHETLVQPFELARSLFVQGQILRRAKRKALARAALQQAQHGFELLGSSLWSQRAAGELARIAGRRPRAPGGLTPTEERVARLAADGQTNSEIAAALHLSVNTVQAYLKRIYRELGVRSRTELARRFPSLPPVKSTDFGVSAPSDRS